MRIILCSSITIPSNIRKLRCHLNISSRKRRILFYSFHLDFIICCVFFDGFQLKRIFYSTFILFEVERVSHTSRCIRKRIRKYDKDVYEMGKCEIIAKHKSSWGK